MRDRSAAEEGPDPGLFQVERFPVDDTPLTVYFSTGGSAVAGLDYKPLGGVGFAVGSVVIPEPPRVPGACRLLAVRSPIHDIRP